LKFFVLILLFMSQSRSSWFYRSYYSSDT